MNNRVVYGHGRIQRIFREKGAADPTDFSGKGETMGEMGER